MVSSRCRALDRLDRVDRSEADRDSVQGVYHADEEGKLHFLIIREMSVEPGIIIVGRMGVGDAGQRLGSGQGGTPAVGIERALAPGIEQIDGFFAFPKARTSTRMTPVTN